MYATHPKELNDLYDCSESLITFDEDGENVKVFLGPCYEFAKEAYPNKRDFMRFVNNAYCSILYKKFGVLSLTDNCLNNCMWGYYGSHKGFCVEFDVKKFPFRYFGPFPVNYVHELKELEVSKFGVQSLVAYQTNVKKVEWQHESEWRLIISNPLGYDMLAKGDGAELLNQEGDVDRKFYYPLDALLSITLGHAFFCDMNCVKISSKEFSVQFGEDSKSKQIVDYLCRTHVPTAHLRKYGLKAPIRQPIKIVKLKTNLYRVIDIE